MLGLWLAAMSCAHQPSVRVQNKNGRIYEGDEAAVKAKVTQWFALRGVALRPSPTNRHELVSVVKEVQVGVVKGLTRDPTAPTGPAQAPGNSSNVVGSIDAETRRAETANLGDTSREGARDFSDFLSNRGQSWANATGAGDTWGHDRPVSVERSQWHILFIPVDAGRTQVQVLKTQAADWGASADKSFLVGANPVTQDKSSSNAAGTSFTNRDLPSEVALAEYVDASAAVEVVNNEELSLIQPAKVDLPEGVGALENPPTERCEIDAGPFATLEPGSVMLLADPTGTEQAPSTLAKLVCSALATGRQVTVALPVSASEQKRINTYVDSEGTEADRVALLVGGFWNRDWQDGRSSLAMANLIEALRARRRAGQHVAVLAVDAELNGNPRNAFVSARLLEHHRENPQRVIIALLSNTQASLRAGTPWNMQLLPVGYRLSAAGVAVKSYDVGFESGSQWVCRLFAQGRLRCGTWNVTPGPKQRNGLSGGTFTQFTDTSAEGFDGLWFIGRVKASAPAKARLRRDEGAWRSIEVRAAQQNDPGLF